MMGALAAMADFVDELEKAAERDEANERAFVLVIEATGVLLQGLEQAKAATQALRAATAEAAAVLGRPDHGHLTPGAAAHATRS